MPIIQLTGPLTIKIEKALLAAFPQENDFSSLVSDSGYTLDQVSGPKQPLPTRILETLKHAEAHDWLLALISKAAGLRPADPVLRDLHSELGPQAPPPNLSPYYMCRLGSGTVMVDRKPLRAAVEELHDLQGRRVLVIKGDSWSGKSHSVQLITFIADVVGGFTLVELDLDPHRDDQTRLVITARDLASRLIRLMGYQIAWPESSGDRQWSKWVTEFGDEFARCAATDATRRWIVIDGMNKVLLDQSAVDLVQDLTTRIYKSLPRLRLVLVGYEQSLPPLIMPYIQEEKVARIGDNDLIEFFVLAHEELSRPHDEDSLADIVLRILNQVDMTSSDYLVKLGPLVALEILRIKQGR
jgi:hypothetical protein